MKSVFYGTLFPFDLGGQRYYSIRDLVIHLQTCQDETFYDASNHLQDRYWVEAPKGKHIIICEDATNVVLKTSGIWVMPDPSGTQVSSDPLRGFWVMPSFISEYYDDQMQQQQEKLRLEQEQKRIQEEQAEQARLQREEEELLIQQQLLEQQQKLRLQQQVEEQQKQQMLLQQQLQRQNQSVVQSISSVPNTVPIVKSSPTAVINQNIQRSHSAATNTIIVLNDDHIFSQSGTDALRCIQASDGSYHVISNVDLNDRQVTNATSVIAHTSPAIDNTPISTPVAATSTATTSTGRKRRTRKQNSTYTQSNDSNELITLENVVYQAPEPTVSTPVTNKTNYSKRRRGAQQQTIETQSIAIDSNQTVIQNVDATDILPQQIYLAYNDNGVLVPIDATSTLMKNDSDSNAVDLSQEQYIIEDLDASRKAQQQKSRKSATSRQPQQLPPPPPLTPASSSVSVANVNLATSSSRVIVPDTNVNDLSAYNIDDLSHLDKPIVTEKPSTIVPIKPLKRKKEFMESFITFLTNRESNKL